jgi:hypothetical protein
MLLAFIGDIRIDNMASGLGQDELGNPHQCSTSLSGTIIITTEPFSYVPILSVPAEAGFKPLN